MVVVIAISSSWSVLSLLGYPSRSIQGSPVVVLQGPPFSMALASSTSIDQGSWLKEVLGGAARLQGQPARQHTPDIVVFLSEEKFFHCSEGQIRLTLLVLFFSRDVFLYQSRLSSATARRLTGSTEILHGPSHRRNAKPGSLACPHSGGWIPYQLHSMVPWRFRGCLHLGSHICRHHRPSLPAPSLPTVNSSGTQSLPHTCIHICVKCTTHRRHTMHTCGAFAVLSSCCISSKVRPSQPIVLGTRLLPAHAVRAVQFSPPLCHVTVHGIGTPLWLV